MQTLEQRHTHWQSIMDNYEGSGLSQQKFCDQNQIDFRKFKYYRWQLAKRSNKKISSELSDVKLAPVTLKQPHSANKLYIKHPNGIECHIPCDISETELLNVLRGLRAC